MTVLVEKSTVNVDEGIDNLIDGMIEDYNNWSRNDNMKNRFASNFSVSKGQKYIKVINDNSVKCFINHNLYVHHFKLLKNINHII